MPLATDRSTRMRWLRPPTRLESPNAAVHVWRVSLSESASSWPDVLSRDERGRAERLLSEVDRRRFVIAHTALRCILARYLDIHAAALVFERAEHGKPALCPPPCGPRLRFNLSHSGDLALVAVSLTTEIGIDVERLRRTAETDRIAERFFSPAERETLRQIPASKRHHAFFATWVLKEAYLKACGDGLSRGLDAFCVTADPDTPPRLLAVRDRPGDETRWALHRLRPRPGYVAALVAEAGNRPARFLNWSS